MISKRGLAVIQLFFLMFAAAPFGASAATVRIEPAAIQAHVGEIVSFDVVADGIPAEGLGAFQFTIETSDTGIGTAPDTVSAPANQITVVTPLQKNGSDATHSGLGADFVLARGSNGILEMVNESLNAGRATYVFAHTYGATLPSGAVSIARFHVVVGGDNPGSQNYNLRLRDVRLFNGETEYTVDFVSGGTLQVGCAGMVPDLSGMDRQSAINALGGEGLLTGVISSDYHDTIPSGFVVSQGLSSGTRIPCNTRVDFVVSLGSSNTAPVFNPISDRVVAENELLAFTVSATDEEKEPLSYGAQDLPTGATFDPAQARFTWTPGFEQSGDYDVVFTVTDGELTGANEIVHIRVTNVNRAPVLAPIGPKTTKERAKLSFQVTATDEDLDLITFSASPLLSGAVFNGVTGAFDWTPTRGQAGSYNVTFSVTDNGTPPLSDSETVTITVLPGNDSPVAADDAYSVDEDTPLNIGDTGVLGNDSDADNDALTAVLVTGPSSGTLTLNAQGSFNYVPNENWHGVDTFTYKAHDGELYSNVATVTITVNPVNDPPAASPDADFMVDEDSPLIIAAPGVLGNDSDVDGDSLTSSFVTGPSNGTVTLNGDGSFTYTPNGNWNGTDSFTYKANDGVLDSNAATVTITVKPVNDAPVAVGDTYSTDEDTTLNIATPGVLGNDSDVDGGSITALSVIGVSHGALTLNTDGSLTYTPSADWNGTDSFTYKANDGALDSGMATVTIAVNPVNDAPEVSADPSSQSVQYSDGITTVTISGRDIDSSYLTIGVSSLPEGLSLSEEGCTETGGVVQCRWALDGRVLAGVGAYDMTFTVSDGALESLAHTTLVVGQENAKVAFDDSNLVAVKVAVPSGNSGAFDLVLHVSEALPDLAGDGLAHPGDISRSVVAVSLVPVGPGSTASPTSCTATASGTDYDAVLTLTCSFSNVAVNTYTVQVTVNGAYYHGDGEDALVVYDPSLGFTTGGGWFYWPGTEDPVSGYPGDRTNFGFTMKYGKNGTNVKGSLLLISHMPDGTIYRVKSNALYGLALGVGQESGGVFGWASFSGKATYQEPGWPTPIGNYEFVVYIEDHNEPGTGTDRFWIEVKDKDGKVVGVMSMLREAVNHAVDLDGGNVVAPH